MKLDNNEYVQIQKTLLKFEKEYQLEVLIAALGGSLSIGTHNSLSDCDIYVIYHHPENKILPRKLHCYTANMHEIHIISCSEQEIVEALQKYTAVSHSYPSYLNRTEDEVRLNHQLSMYEREDYPRTLVFYTLMADVIWTFQTPIDEIYQKFKCGLTVSDVLDFYYTKAYGNYEHFLISEDIVLARKYITTIQEILYCRWLYEKKTIPPMDVCALMSVYKDTLPHKINKEIEAIFQINKSTKKDKFKKFVPASDSLNQYIHEWLQIMKENLFELEGIYLKI